MQGRALPLIVAASLLILGVPVQAGHGGDPLTVHKTYEEAVHNTAGLILVQQFDDPTGQTQDGTLHLGGAGFYPEDVVPGVDSVQASIVDDVYGAGTVVGWITSDENGNNIGGEEEHGEVSVFFCGQSQPVSIPPSPDWYFIIIGVGGEIHQALICNPAAAPTGGTSGGVLNPAGGIYATFG